MSLTQRLLNSSVAAYRAATEHDFLVKAGQRTLSAQVLGQWLSQDFIYALSYQRFIFKQQTLLQERSDGIDLSMEWMAKYAMLLADSARIIKLELNFFEDVSKRYSMSLELASRENLSDQNTKANDTTRAYVELMDSIESVEEGAVLLWGMEKCYLDSWSFASQTPQAQGSKSEALDELITRWTNPNFQKYVVKLADLVDGITVSKTASFDNLWSSLLGLETRFWPVV